MVTESELASLQPVRREQTLGDQVYNELKERLITGKFVPGEQLSLRKVAEQMNVSVMPVRDAVTRFITEEALDVLPNRAVKVPILTQAKFEELTMVRISIEGFAAELAAVNRSAQQLEQIKSFDEAFRYQSRLGTTEAGRALLLNKELHFAVYRASGSPVLCSLIETLWLRAGPVINFFDLSSAQRISSGMAERHHSELVTALIARDAKAAKEAIAADIGDASTYILATGKLPASAG